MDVPKQQDLAHQHVCELTDGGGDHLIVQGAQGADSDHLCTVHHLLQYLL